MIRVGLGSGLTGLALALSLGSFALAQSDSSTDNPNSSVVTPGLARPPASAPKPPAHVKRQPNGSSAVWANQPTLPQVALHPTATIGSGTPIAGAGGSTKSVVGQ